MIIMFLLFTTAVCAVSLDPLEEQCQCVQLHIRSGPQLKTVTWNICGLTHPRTGQSLWETLLAHPYMKPIRPEDGAFSQNRSLDIVVEEFVKTLATRKGLSNDASLDPPILSEDKPYFTAPDGWMWWSGLTENARVCVEGRVQIVFKGRQTEEGLTENITLEGFRRHYDADKEQIVYVDIMTPEGGVKTTPWDIRGLTDPNTGKSLRDTLLTHPYMGEQRPEDRGFVPNCALDAVLGQFTEALASGKGLSNEESLQPPIVHEDTPYLTTPKRWVWWSGWMGSVSSMFCGRSLAVGRVWLIVEQEAVTLEGRPV